MDKRAVYLQASHVENMVNARFRRCRIGKVKMKREALPNPVVSPPATIKDLRRWIAESPGPINWWDRVIC